MTMNKHWGYNKHDDDWKSAATLVHNLVDIVSKGGNYLLNVGPTSEGVIPGPAVERLEEMGRWLKVNGEAIYGAGPTPFGGEVLLGDKWRFTTKPGKLFVALYRWPGDLPELPSMQTKVTKARLLAAPDAPLTINHENGRVTISLPKEAPDEIGSVIGLDLETGS